MATLEKSAEEETCPGSQTSAGGGGPPPPDNVRLHPFLYPYQLKASPSSKPFKQLSKLLSADGDRKKRGKAFAAALEEARGSALAAVTTDLVSQAARDEALAKYLSLLQGLVDSPAPPSNGKLATGQAGSPDDGGLDAALAEAGAGTAPAGLPTASAAGSLRHAAQFTWTDAVVGSSAATSSDALFELVSIAIAAVLAGAAQVARLCEDSATGVATEASTTAYTLLREGAGKLQWLRAQALPQLSPTSSDDCSPQVVASLESLLLADAQSLTTLRALAKGNAPPLVAALALDTAALYRDAADQLGRSPVPAAAGAKLSHYLRYKQALFNGYAQLHSGIDQWQARQAPGAGLRCLQEAGAALEAAKRAASAFDAAPPATMNIKHRRHDEGLADKLADVQRRMKREADMVYFQAMASSLPQLPSPRRLVSPLPYALPPPAAQLSEGVLDCFQAPPPPPAAPAGAAAAGGGVGATPAGAAVVSGAAAPAAGAPAGEEQQPGCSCWRWTIFLIVTPLLLAISLVGVVVWVVLLPVKIMCCPVGCLVQMLYNVVEVLVKMPLRWASWAAGKPWERAPPPQAAVKH